MERLWKKRTDYTIYFEVVNPGTKIHNYLENVDYVTDENRCVVLKGTRSEQWPVNREKIYKSYNFVDPSYDGSLKVGDIGGLIPKPDGNIVWAEPVFTPTEVETSWGDTLHANTGDYIISSCNEDGSPNRNDRWVINGGVFIDTYEYAE